jgi:hypothetical protein
MKHLIAFSIGLLPLAAVQEEHSAQDENCRLFHNYLNIQYLQSGLQFSGTYDAVRIAEPFVTR